MLQHSIFCCMLLLRAKCLLPDNIVKAKVLEIELNEKIKTCTNNNLSTENLSYGITQKLAYNLLPCSPFCLFITCYYFKNLYVYSSCIISNRSSYFSSVSMVIESILGQDMVCADDNANIY